MRHTLIRGSTLSYLENDNGSTRDPFEQTQQKHKARCSTPPAADVEEVSSNAMSTSSERKPGFGRPTRFDCFDLRFEEADEDFEEDDDLEDGDDFVELGDFFDEEEEDDDTAADLLDLGEAAADLFDLGEAAALC